MLKLGRNLSYSRIFKVTNNIAHYQFKIKYGELALLDLLFYFFMIYSCYKNEKN